MFLTNFNSQRALPNTQPHFLEYLPAHRYPTHIVHATKMEVNPYSQPDRHRKTDWANNFQTSTSCCHTKNDKRYAAGANEQETL